MLSCPYKKPDRIICKSCQKQYQMPHIYCCLEECGEHEFCKNCDKGIKTTDWVEKVKEELK